MSLAKLENKVKLYRARDWVSVTENSFGKLCSRVQSAASENNSVDIKSITAKLFAIIGSQKKTSAATALFSNVQQVNDLGDVPWCDIDWYSAHPWRPSISGMYCNRGFPDRAAVKSLESWVEENASGEQRRGVFSSITGMQAGRGVPKITELDSIQAWCVLHSSPETWTALFSSVTGMQHRRGVPKTTELDSIRAWCVLHSSPETWTTLFSSVTGMQHGRGIPTIQVLEISRLKLSLHQ